MINEDLILINITKIYRKRATTKIFYFKLNISSCKNYRLQSIIFLLKTQNNSSYNDVVIFY